MHVPLHPFGPPMEAALTRDGEQLVLSWTAAEDDWVIVGDLSGAFAAAPDGLTGEALLAGSPAVQDYLAPHLVLSQAGETCEREWLPTEDLLGEGVRAGFSCPDPEAPVTVHLDVLTDVNEAYRTVLRTSDQDVLFTATAPTHEVAAGEDGPGGAGGATLLVLALLLVGVVLGAGALLLARRARAVEVAR